MKRAYSLDHLQACLYAAEARYTMATSCAEARSWLNQTHALRDRISAAKVQS